MTCEKIMKEKRREIINDSMQALHALAKMMPQLNAQCSPVEMLEIINSGGKSLMGQCRIRRRAARGLCRRRDVSRL